jgi:hypothetical protein
MLEEARAMFPHVETMLALADRTGVFFWLGNTQIGGERLLWPGGASETAANMALSIYKARRERERKRDFVVTGSVEGEGWQQKSLMDAITTAHIEVPSRIAMRALNAPLQVISDGIAAFRAKTSRPIACYEVSDRLNYSATQPAGARMIVQILLSKEVQHMIHHGNHYSRSRNSGR